MEMDPAAGRGRTVDEPGIHREERMMGELDERFMIAEELRLLALSMGWKLGRVVISRTEATLFCFDPIHEPHRSEGWRVEACVPSVERQFNGHADTLAGAAAQCEVSLTGDCGSGPEFDRRRAERLKRGEKVLRGRRKEGMTSERISAP